MKFQQKYNKIIKIIIILVLIPKLYSQDVFHDPKLSWNTIKSEHFNIHIPIEHAKLGIQITDICERIYPIVSHSLDYKPRLTHVVVHTENDESNGFASPFPWRMELFVSVPQSNITGKNTIWLESLILHEFTHITHLRKHKGLSTITKPLLGEFNAIWQMITPVWFTEGMATLNETRFSSGGRGRNPHFWMQMAEPVLNNNQWKLKNTNYYSRRKLPTYLMQYVSGYYIMDGVTKQFGEYAWGRILNHYSAHPVFGFKNAIKSVTGLSVNGIYDDIVNEFKTQKQSKLIDNDYKIWSDIDQIESQHSPRWVDTDNILFYRKGISNTQNLVMVNRSGEEKEVLNRKITNINNSFTYRDSFVYTSEKYIHQKYGATKYSDLLSYDLTSGIVKRLTKNDRLYSIDISQDNSKLVAVQTNLPENRLAIIDNKNGEILQYINFGSFAVLNPRWSPSGYQIVFALQDSAGVVNIAVYNLNSNTWRYIYESNLNQDNHPCWSSDEKYVYFSSDQSGIFNIWATDVKTGKRWMITDAELGAFTPDVSPLGDEIVFSVYTSHGFRIATQKLNSSSWIESNKIINENNLLYTQDETTFSEIESEENREYRIEKYSPLTQIMRPQGWIPYIYDDEEGLGVATFLRAEDALHRHNWYGRFGLSLNRKAPAFDMNYIFSKYWPKINIRAYSLPKKIRNDNETGWWRENGFDAGVTTTLVLEDNIYKTISSLSMQVIQNQLKKSKGNIYPNQNIYRGTRLEFNLSRSSYTFKNITPYFAWLFNTKMEISNTSLLSDYDSRRFSSELDVFLPVRGSNLELYVGYLSRSGDYNYTNNFVPIGFSNNNSNQQYRITSSYYQPLSFIEWQTPLIPIFVEYIYLKPFIDYGIGYFNNSAQTDVETVHSIGFQLSTKNVMFYRYNFEMGINIYQKSTNREIQYNPFIRFNL